MFKSQLLSIYSYRDSGNIQQKWYTMYKNHFYEHVLTGLDFAVPRAIYRE